MAASFPPVPDTNTRMTTESATARIRSIFRTRGVSASTLVLMVMASASCSKSPAPATSVLDDPAAGWTFVITVAPDHLRMVRPATFTLNITGSDRKPVENAQVTGSLNMTLMDMGTTAVKFQPKGNGVYEVTVSGFDMSGPWKIAIDVVWNRMHAHKVFPITVFD
jgi:hypothetical protein